ncbi:hypothetical protein [Pseudarthrobacter sp. DSP2-3-2b1]|uniref:hypothetical protein n=1 Tax=Pseudarthrobacter sp. DSP2-3-2b1 TaxID=2804661 RepID=UPI003CEDECC0
MGQRPAGQEAGTQGLAVLHRPRHHPPRRNRQRIRGEGAVATAATSVAAAAIAASIIFSPVPDASARMDGVSEDLLRAVQLKQITEEQAVKFEARLAGRILGDA